MHDESIGVLSKSLQLLYAWNGAAQRLYIHQASPHFFWCSLKCVRSFDIHANGGAGTPTSQLGEEAPPSFQMPSRTGCRIIIQPWVGRATRTNVRGVTSASFFPLMASLMTNAPFSRRPAM